MKINEINPVTGITEVVFGGQECIIVYSVKVGPSRHGNDILWQMGFITLNQFTLFLLQKNPRNLFHLQTPFLPGNKNRLPTLLTFKRCWCLSFFQTVSLMRFPETRRQRIFYSGWLDSLHTPNINAHNQCRILRSSIFYSPFTKKKKQQKKICGDIWIPSTPDSIQRGTNDFLDKHGKPENASSGNRMKV